MVLSVLARRNRIRLAGALVAAASLAMAIAAEAQQSTVECKPTATLQRVPELPEGSGLAASRRTPGRFWSHNDSGEPVLFALDGSGRVTGRLSISGANVEDWEAVAVGPCSSGSCIYVADIGDNDGVRKRITVYRIVEPADANGSATVADTLHATYPDGSHDAEALLVTPDGHLLIVTKGDTGLVSLYRFPSEFPTGTTLRLERVGAPREARAPSENDRITDGAVSPDGQWIVLRTTRALAFYQAADLLAGNWREAGRVALGSVGEPQGEGVAFGSHDTVYLMSEGGGKKQPGAFARLTCTFKQ
jgi:glucose/arabinose dehydrogenase